MASIPLFFSAPVSGGSLKTLIKRWTSRYPDAKMDPMNVWDDIIISRWVIWVDLSLNKKLCLVRFNKIFSSGNILAFMSGVRVCESVRTWVRVCVCDLMCFISCSRCFFLDKIWEKLCSSPANSMEVDGAQQDSTAEDLEALVKDCKFHMKLTMADTAWKQVLHNHIRFQLINKALSNLKQISLVLVLHSRAI